MKKEDLELFAREAAKGLKTEKDLNDFSHMLTKVFVEAALNVELDEHLGYSKHEKSGPGFFYLYRCYRDNGQVKSNLLDSCAGPET
jgi:transposase-like protein